MVKGGLKKRIIPCLDIKDGRTVKGVNFLDLIDAGDPVELAVAYAEQGADELVFLDITAGIENRKTLLHLVEDIADHLHIPFTVGGGIHSVEDAYAVLRAGADKISVNSAAVKRPDLINELADKFGNQSVVLAIDGKKEEDGYWIYTGGGRVRHDINVFDWMKEGVKRGAGEILFTSMDHDGTKSGFALEGLQEACTCVNVPIIASGGAGKTEHFEEVFEKTDASGALAASVFHFGEIRIPELKSKLDQKGILIRKN